MISFALSVAAIILAVYGTVWAHRRVRAAEEQTIGCMRVNHLLVSRLAETGCDVCGRRFEEDQQANLRVGPDGEVILGHPFCLGPLPGSGP